MSQPPTPPCPPLVAKVEVSVAARNLRNMDFASKSDPVCVLYYKDTATQRLSEVGRTEKINDNLNPQWVKKFELDYFFERKQILQFHVFDWDQNTTDVSAHDKLGFAEVSIGEIMSAGGGQRQVSLENGSGGVLLLSGEEVVATREVIELQLAADDLDRKDWFGKSDPYLAFSKVLGSGEDLRQTQTSGTVYNYNSMVHKTEVLYKTLNPVWKPFEISAWKICSGDLERKIKIECFDWNEYLEHSLIGECYVTLAQLKQIHPTNNTFDLINPKKKAKKSSYKNSGKLIFKNCRVREEPTFLDHIKDGLQMHFTVAVDFTASNGDPRQPGSLHHVDHVTHRDNQYSAAIKAVGEIVEQYDSDKMFPALGFGARVPPNFQVSHQFFLNGSADNPYCQGVGGVLSAYHHSLQTVQLYGPTNFSPVIDHVATFASALQDGRNYFVLLIVTDGIITDMQHTVASIVRASHLPMSVIIVGVGGEDFTDMAYLDGDERLLQSGGTKAARDIVQFVEFRKHEDAMRSNPDFGRSMLAKEVLEEIPGQVNAWMKYNKGRSEVGRTGMSATAPPM